MGRLLYSISVDLIFARMQPDDPVVVYDDEHYYMTNVTAAHFARLGNEVTLVTPQPYFAELMGYTLEQPCVSK